MDKKKVTVEQVPFSPAVEWDAAERGLIDLQKAPALEINQLQTHTEIRNAYSPITWLKPCRSIKHATEGMAATAEEGMTLEEARKHVFRNTDSYSRLEELLRLLGPVVLLGWSGTGPLPYNDWLTLLGETWSTCDNLREYVPVLRKLLGTVGPLRNVMTTHENAAYDALPDTVECFRGCDRSVLTGASWSLDWETANSFPFTYRYLAPSPVVVTARVKKDRILAIKLGRKESEIITFSARRLKVKPADADRASAYHAANHAANHAALMLSLKTIEATQASAGPSTTAIGGQMLPFSVMHSGKAVRWYRDPFLRPPSILSEPRGESNCGNILQNLVFLRLFVQPRRRFAGRFVRGDGQPRR